MSSIENNLLAIGLSSLEISLYSALLQKRPLSLAALTDTAGTSRSNCVYGVQKLRERGLVVFRVRGKRKYVDIVDPAHAFSGLLDEEARNHAKKEKSFLHLQGIIPALLQQSSGGVQTLSGVAGFRHVLVDFIAQKEDLYWIGSLSTIFKAFTEDEVRSLVTLPRMKGATTIYHLADQASLRYPKFLESIGTLREVRITPEELPGNCVLGWTSKKLAIVTMKEGKNISVTVIDDPATMKMFDGMFRMLWCAAKPI